MVSLQTEAKVCTVATYCLVEQTRFQVPSCGQCSQQGCNYFGWRPHGRLGHIQNNATVLYPTLAGASHNRHKLN